MRGRKRKKWIGLLVFGMIAAMIALLSVDNPIMQEADYIERKNTDKVQVRKLEPDSQESSEKKEEEILIPIFVKEIKTMRLSSNEIQICWTDHLNELIEQYVVKKRDMLSSDTAWEVVETVEVEKQSQKEEFFITDTLESKTPQLYEYRVDVVPTNPKQYEAQEGESALASNVMVCIDPGHYEGKNEVTGEASYGYAEGDFTLKLALELQDILKSDYGIDSYLTRETGNITIAGYSDSKLDSGHISLRGEYAAEKDSDLFVSLHTNANEDNANGYATCMQPIEINKPIILVNTIAVSSEMAIRASNAIGVNLADASYKLGISTEKDFEIAEEKQIEEWTPKKNDALNSPGTVYCRLGEKGDFYGVLRGAANVNTSGIIIEHGFHTVPEVRKAAAESSLAHIWAQADAYGIAYGFGFVTEMKMQK